MIVPPVNQLVSEWRNMQRAAGLCPIQIWVPDTRRAGFAEECRRQSQVVASADTVDTGVNVLVDAAFFDLDDEASG